MSNRDLQYQPFCAVLERDNCERALKQWFYFRTKKILNLDNPTSFNEKIQWLKLYDSTRDKTRLTDKDLVREWIKQTIGEEYLIKTLGVWDSADDIDFDTLPKKFILKATHGSRWYIIVKDKDTLDIEETRKTLKNWLGSDYGSRRDLELHYMPIKPQIIAQEYIEEIDGNQYDYRFFCFNGKPEFIWYDIDVGDEEYYRYFDMDWNLLDYKKAYPEDTGETERPENLEEMVAIAKKLCAGFATVRVDLYDIKGKIYFCELTFTSNSGTAAWKDDAQDEYLGSLIPLPPKSPMPTRKIGKVVSSDIAAPKISIVIPPLEYAEGALAACFDSIVNQSLKEIEIIYINNSAQDYGKCAAEEFAQKDSRIAILDLRAPMDLASACGSGVKIAKGEYIFFVDGNDYLAQNALERLYSTAKENAVDVLMFDADYDIEGDEPEAAYVPPCISREKCLNQVMSGEDMLALQQKQKEYLSPAALYITKSESLKNRKIKFSSRSIFDDELFTPMLLSDAGRVMCIADKLYIRRIDKHLTSACSCAIDNFISCFIAYEEHISKYVAAECYDIGLLLSAENIYNKSLEIYKQLPKEERQQIKGKLQAEYRALYLHGDYRLEDAKEKERELNKRCEEGRARERNLNKNLEEAKVRERNLNKNLEEGKVRERNLNKNLEEGKVRERNLNNNLEEARARERNLNKNLEEANVREMDLRKKLQEDKAREEAQRKKIKELAGINTRLTQQIEDMRSGIVFRILWKVRGGIHCIKDHGLRYTVKLFFRKVFDRFFDTPYK